MIYKKGKDYLKDAGVKKTHLLIKKFTLQFEDSNELGRDIREQIKQYDAENLKKSKKEELACTFAALLLHDSRKQVNALNMKALLKSTGNKIDEAISDQFAKNISELSIPNLLKNVGKPAEVWDNKQDDFDQEDVDMGGMFAVDDDDY